MASTASSRTTSSDKTNSKLRDRKAASKLLGLPVAYLAEPSMPIASHYTESFAKHLRVFDHASMSNRLISAFFTLAFLFCVLYVFYVCVLFSSMLYVVHAAWFFVWFLVFWVEKGPSPILLSMCLFVE
jgi:hypothetical protein